MQLDEQYQKMFDEFVKKRRKSKRKPQKIVINVQQPPPPQLTIESPKPVPLRLPTPQPLIEPPVIYSPRKESPILVNLLEVGDKVLAKWPDDGWYYKSQIIQVIDPDNYRIKDSIEDTEFIRRDDIIPEKHNSDLIEATTVTFRTAVNILVYFFYRIFRLMIWWLHCIQTMSQAMHQVDVLPCPNTNMK